MIPTDSILEFQIYDWFEDNNIDDDDDDENSIGEYVINIFGRCENGKSVYTKLFKYKPYFYILIPDEYQNKSLLELNHYKKKIFEELKDTKKIYYKYKLSLIKIELIESKIAEGFNNNKLLWFMKIIFNNLDGMKKYKYYLENNFKLYEANLPPMFRCFHLRDISGCSWVEVNNYKKYERIDDDKQSHCDIEIWIKWDKINPIKKNKNAPLRICSFDIECYSHDNQFPMASRIEDMIIQIGATYTYIGESVPYRQYIACLNDTSAQDNIINENYDSEKELILGFIEELKKNDCDIITGYNIFYFDEKYIYDRCNLLNLNHDILYISKLKNYKCKFKEMNLSSSALGQNILKYFDTPGRVHIDLMKDIQKTFSLSSYKLDYVASQYIRGSIINYKLLETGMLELECDYTNDIYINDYIHIEIIKGFISDEIDNKYLVLNIIDNKIYINYNDILLSILKENKQSSQIINNNSKITNIYWSQAKDDINAKDIFKLFKQTASDRGVIAKYCIKDCKLVNLLINKLEVITKNIEMANVCYVPLSYLFVRGQGIKLFSLCLKEYNKQNYIFPVIKLNKLYSCGKCSHEFYNLFECPKCKSRKKEEKELEKNISYEGAIVFDPIQRVEYEALAIKDYMSLYPSSIIQKNMSHETIVEDNQYDNLKNVNYFSAQFKENDGSIKHYKYACINNKLGVIPTILDNLLKERAIVKKIMKTETDKFKYKILDAKQFAIKITANSLYGQLGAPTSPICKREIAACTTSTGREMLLLAKKYDEVYLSYIINSLKYYYKNNDTDNMLYLLNLELLNNKFNDEIVNYINEIQNICLQPIVRYGDTDSIFTCFRFKDNCILVNKHKSLIIWQEIIKFAQILIEPFMNDSDRDLFDKLFNKYYSNIIDLTIPIIDDNLDNNIILFLNEYMTDNYLPWLWTLTELVEINQISMFNIKLIQHAEYLLNKYNIDFNNLYNNSKSLLIEPIEKCINNIFINNQYEIELITKENILELYSIILNNNIYCLTDQTKIKLYESCKIFLTKTIKDKWILSSSRSELKKIILTYYKKIIIINEQTEIDKKNKKQEETNFINLIIKLKETNENIEEHLTIINSYNKEQIEEHTKAFDIKYNKNNGAKTMNQLIETFIEKELELDFNLIKNNYYNKIVKFIENTIIKYYIQPRWEFINDKKIYKIDIYQSGNNIIDKRTVDYTIQLGKISSELIKKYLPFPHNCEYEKTYNPLILLNKKRYVGYKYEFDSTKSKLDFMGIVLKRRDNAPIVKEICNGIIDYLINKRDPEGAKQYTIECLTNMFNGKYNIKYFLQSRTLKMKDSYIDWRKIAHVFLADKIADRSPGEVPQAGDRIEYAVIKIPNNNNKKLLQGEIIETPEYIINNKLEIDYLFYLTNQIMNPALQFLELIDNNAKNIFIQFINKYASNLPKKKIKDPENYINEINNLINKFNNKIKLLNNVKFIKLTTETNQLYNNINSLIISME